MLAGVALMAAGVWLLTRLTHRHLRRALTTAMIVLGVGLGLCLQQYTLLVQNASARGDLGVATASTQFFRNVGSTVGIAIFGTVMTTGLQAAILDHLPASAAAKPAASGQQIGVGSVLDPAAIEHAQPGGGRCRAPGVWPSGCDVFLLGLPILALVFVATALIKSVPLRSTNHARRPGRGQARNPGRARLVDDQPGLLGGGGTAKRARRHTPAPEPLTARGAGRALRGDGTSWGSGSVLVKGPSTREEPCQPLCAFTEGCAARSAS